jgi:tetratricopeptide (TPR) repeat protein
MDGTVRLWRACAEDDAQRAAALFDLEDRVSAIARADAEEQRQTIADVEALLKKGTSLISRDGPAAKKGLSPFSHDVALAASAARALADSGNHELALEACRRFATVIGRSEDPQWRDLPETWSLIPWTHRGRLCARQNQWEEAVANYTEAIDLDPAQWRYWDRRGAAHAQLEQWEQAAGDFSKAIDLGVEPCPYWRDLGRACAVLGRWELAAERLPGVVRHATHQPSAWDALAAIQLQAGLTEAYKRTCGEAFQRYSDSHHYRPKVRMLRTCSLAPDCGIDRQQLTRLADTALAESDSGEGQLAKGMDDYRCGRYEQALAHLPPSGDALNRPLTLLFQAMSHHRLGHARQARKLLERAVRVIEETVPTVEGPPLTANLPDRWIVWCSVDVVRREAQETVSGPVYESLDKADELIATGKLAEAAEEFTQAISLAPANPDLWFGRGHLYAQMGQRQEATADYTKAIELAPESWSGWSDRATAYALLGQWDRAARDQARVVEAAPKDHKQWRALAAAHLVSGDLEACRDTCRRAFEQYSDAEHPVVRAQLLLTCCLASDCGIDREELTRLAERTLGESDTSNLAPHGKGMVLLAKGMNDYRCGRFEEAIEHLPESGDVLAGPLALLFRMMACHRLGRTAEARVLLEQGVRDIDGQLPTIEGTPLAEYLPERWAVWCMLRIVRDEAAELILGTASPEALENLSSPEQLAVLVEHLTKAAERAPDDPDTLLLRAAVHTRLSQWGHAADDYKEAIRLRPERLGDWWCAAALLILAGDTEGYRAHCRAMLEQFAGQEDFVIVNGVIAVCSLLPDVVEVSELPVATLEDFLEDDSTPNWRRPAIYLARARAAYRAGDPQGALDWSVKLKATDTYAERPAVQARVLLVEAMAHYQLNQSHEAVQSLAEASQLIETHLPRLASGRLGKTWLAWLTAEILRREAEQVIAEHKATTPEARPGPNPQTE